jgi:hypothetical protein
VKTRLYIEANQILLIESIGVFEMAIVVNNTLIKIEDSDINAEGQFIFPEKVTRIGESAFKDNNNVKTIIVPNTVTEIENYAFKSCLNLRHVVFSDSVTEVGRWAFFECSDLRHVTLSDSVTNIRADTFACCTNLTHITLPDGVRMIGPGAFFNCGRLTHITLPDGVTETGPNAFYGCKSLTHITLSDSLTKIDEESFDGCRSLSRICIIADDLDKFEAVKALLPLRLQGKAVYLSKDTARSIEAKKRKALNTLLNTPLISPLSKCVDLIEDVVICINKLEGKRHPLAERLIEKMDALDLPEEGDDEGLNEYELSITESLKAILQAAYSKSRSEPSFSVIGGALNLEGLEEALSGYLIKFKRYSDKRHNFLSASNLSRSSAIMQILLKLLQPSKDSSSIFVKLSDKVI